MPFLLLFVIVTTLIATRAIFRITPKDATISNEAKRKPLPKPMQKFIDKAPMNIKLGTNSICQNPRRFFVSSFSIFASLVLILLSTLFFVSKEEMIDQSVNRRLNYNAQVYLTTKDDEFGNVLQSFTDGSGAAVVSAYESCYYTYLKVDTNNDDKVYLECLAVKEGLSNLVTIPDQKGKGNLAIPKTGVILPKSSAEKLKVKKGDSISINGVAVKVEEINRPSPTLSTMANTASKSFMMTRSSSTMRPVPPSPLSRPISIRPTTILPAARITNT